MLFLANWSVMSLGQLYALVTPNEETANGLAGLSVILSVCLMGFLITSSAMPSYWTWAYQANLFRYILQGEFLMHMIFSSEVRFLIVSKSLIGLVTNELSGQKYHIDIGQLIPEIDTNSTQPARQNTLGSVFNDEGNNLKAITFLKGDLPEGDNLSAQASRLVGLALNTEGENADTPESQEDLKSLMSCLVENDCMVEPVHTNFILCTADFSSVCANEFRDLISHHEDGENQIAKCFDNDSYYHGESDVLTKTTESHHKVASCMMRKLLPSRGVSSIIRGFRDLQKIVMAIQDIVEKGLDIPGDVILFYFGWAQFDTNTLTFEAPWKWHYCVTAVSIFLVGMELIKLFAVNFIVWTKR